MGSQVHLLFQTTGTGVLELLVGPRHASRKLHTPDLEQHGCCVAEELPRAVLCILPADTGMSSETRSSLSRDSGLIQYLGRPCPFSPLSLYKVHRQINGIKQKPRHTRLWISENLVVETEN